jgi:uncharacterized protein DUF1553/uncharacterized protein DUF1549
MNSRLYFRNPLLRNGLRQSTRPKKSLALIIAREFTTRLGTAHTLASALVLAFSLTVAVAQEDVAETKANFKIDTTPITEIPITPADRSHWSFAPIQRHPQPATKNTHWLRTGIDAFILARLEAKDLGPAPEADRQTLLRRLAFDLTGLPPTPGDLAAFENDRSPDAYERQVDRLLASPAFGERYGQYWLDLARFAETDGFEHDYVRSQVWRYRDWVIAALNADMPYDQFIRQQLASDEISSEHGTRKEEQDDSALDPLKKARTPNAKSPQPPPLPGQIPSMFCLSGPDMPDVNDQVERRHNLLNEMTGTVGAVFLGLQLGCAQCHNHKYDPISQADFYRLRAVFEPAVATLKRDVPFNVLANQKDAAPARFWVRGDHRRPGLELQPAFPRIASPRPARGTSERNVGSNVGRPANHQTDQPSLAPRASTRTELAAWLVQDENPLTSRVIANRLWQHHFGRGLCVTPSDFGVMGGPVTHPELLDWLATELREYGWGLKRLHRTILASATYRQTSNFKSQISDLQAGDSPNLKSELYGYFPRQRLSGEVIRDAMLAAAGLLTSERGGPGVMPPLPEELLGTLLKGQWNTSQREADHYKRSVYVFARRNLRYPIFEAFDRPDGNATCPIRNRSTTAPQSLLLFNSEFSLLAARHLAARMLNTEEPKNQRADNQTAEQIERLYLIALSRRPTRAETSTLETFLAKQRRRLAAEARPRDELALPVNCHDAADPYAAAALVDACLAVVNASEFIYVD